MYETYQNKIQICVLNTQHSCAKNTNWWKKKIHTISFAKSWDRKFMIC